MELKGILKALLLSVNGKMLNINDFLKAVPDQNADKIYAMLEELKNEGGDVYDIIEVQGHFFARTKLEYTPYLKNFKTPQAEPRQRRALIETLAIIAMRQPVSRAEIEEIRAVQLNLTILHDLLDCGWIKVVKVTSNDAHLYGTTLKFLQDFGLSSVAQMQSLLGV
jgi:segregation and condensation protein B